LLALAGLTALRGDISGAAAEGVQGKPP